MARPKLHKFVASNRMSFESGSMDFRVPQPPGRPPGRAHVKPTPTAVMIRDKLAEIGDAPPGMSIADQAKRLDLGISARSLRRYLASK